MNSGKIIFTNCSYSQGKTHQSSFYISKEILIKKLFCINDKHSNLWTIMRIKNHNPSRSLSLHVFSFHFWFCRQHAQWWAYTHTHRKLFLNQFSRSSSVPGTETENLPQISRSWEYYGRHTQFMKSSIFKLIQSRYIWLWKTSPAEPWIRLIFHEFTTWIGYVLFWTALPKAFYQMFNFFIEKKKWSEKSNQHHVEN